MTEQRHPYEYAVLRAMPRRDRGECVNVGIVLYCQATQYLAVEVHVDEGRLLALDSSANPDDVRDAAEAVRAAAQAGVTDTARDGGGLGALFRWLTAPRSTVVYAGPVHAGMATEPGSELHRLMERLVR